jgi:hypothetical protein
MLDIELLFQQTCSDLLLFDMLLAIRASFYCMNANICLSLSRPVLLISVSVKQSANIEHYFTMHKQVLWFELYTDKTTIDDAVDRWPFTVIQVEPVIFLSTMKIFDWNKTIVFKLLKYYIYGSYLSFNHSL